MTYLEFHEWLLQTFGEESEFTIPDVQQHFDFERKKILNLITQLKGKRLLTRLPQYDKELNRHRKKACYLVHEEEQENLVALNDEEHDQWLAMVKKEQQRRENFMSVGCRI
jgi:hypothetical protein